MSVNQQEEPLGIDAVAPPKSHRAGRLLAWEEIGLEEKIERLRAVLRALPSELNYVRSEVARMSQHQHGERGEMLVPYNTISYGLQGVGSGFSRDPLA